jgi:hypothetical protein
VDEQLALLINAAEIMFRLPRGTILGEDRSQPVVSFRMLAMRVAKDAGYTATEIADSFERDRKTVRQNIGNALRAQHYGHRWWTYAKADLREAWEAAQRV